jgi:hypothetical protein
MFFTQESEKKPIHPSNLILIIIDNLVNKLDVLNQIVVLA